MAVAKMETAAERYRRIAKEQQANEQLFDFTSPSGMVWKLRRPDLSSYVTSGMMPTALAAKVVAATQKANGDNAAAFNSLEAIDKLRAIEFSAKVVRYCAVEPRIVDYPSAPDEIGTDEVLRTDFEAIFNWATSGGDSQADGLNSFPEQSE
jgi:hypothetical protein